MHTSTTPPILFNLSIAEIEMLVSPLDRATALTWAQLDTADERTRAAIRSVDCPEAGEMGAALQRLLDPVVKPAARTRRKSSVKRIPEAVRQQFRGNLFDIFPELEAEAKAADAKEAKVPPVVKVSAPDATVPMSTPGLEAAEVDRDGGMASGSNLRGKRTMNLGARLSALFSRKGTEPTRSR